MTLRKPFAAKSDETMKHYRQQKRLRRRLSIAAALGFACLWSTPGVARPSRYNVHQRPTVNQLPVASLTPLGALSAPEQVQRTSADLPFSVEVPEERKKRAAAKRVDKKKAATSYSAYEHRLTLEANTTDTCLSSADGGGSRVQNRDLLQLYRYNGYRPRGQTVRAERLVDGKEPELLVEDFFVDVETDQVRRVSKTVVRLAPVASDTEGFAIYAFREHSRVNLVLSAPGASMVGPSTNATQLGCGMRRVSLPNDARNGVALSFALGLPRTVSPESVDNFQAYGQVPMERAVRVSVSLSQTSRDRHPVLSVTVGTPNRPIRNALKGSLPRWTDVLGNERAQELQQKLSRR